MKEVKITIPDNCELIKEGDSYIIKEKDSKPRTWEEFCKQNPHSYDEYYIDQESNLVCQPFTFNRDPKVDKKWCTSKEEAEAFLALMQLRQLRKAWVGDWEQPNSNSLTAAILYSTNKQKIIIECGNYWALNVLSFPTKEMATEFLECFRDLCETAKSLL